MTGTIFVTGGSGFVGAALCRRLRRDYPGMTILGLARSETGCRLLERMGVTPVRGCLTDPTGFKEQLMASCWVYHVGANASFGSKADYQSTNVEPTRAIVEILKQSNCLQRLVFTSSIGAIDREPGDNCRLPLTADSPANPSSAYGRSKLAGEQIIRESQLPYTIVRPSWVYGAGMRRQSHVAALLAAASADKAISRIAFPGKVSVIHVDDLAAALAAIPANEKTRDKTYFADDGAARSFGEIFQMGHDLAGQGKATFRPPALITAGMRKMRRFLPFMLGCLFSDVLTCRNDLFSDLDLEIKVPWEEGVRQTWQYVTGPSDGVHVLTGAASGIGEALAKAMSDQGRKLLLIDKSPRLEQIARDMGQDWLTVDLAAGDAVDQIEAHLRKNDMSVDGLVNCAGFGHRGALEAHSPQIIEDITRVNFLTPAQLCRMVLPDMKKHGRGYIMNVISSIAEVPLPGMPMYGATKAALYSLTRSLRGEAAGTGVKVLAVLPSGTRTAFQQSAGVKVLKEGKGLMPPEKVAAIAMKSLSRDRAVTLIGLKSIVLVNVTRLLPQAVAIKLWVKMMSSLR